MAKFEVGDRVTYTGSNPFWNKLGVGVVVDDGIRFENYKSYIGNSDCHDTPPWEYMKKVEDYTPKDIQDNVNSPSHYGQGKIEAIEYIEDFLTEEEYIGYLRGNIGKYLHRFRYKNGLEDLKKANWYLDRLMFLFENKKDPGD